MRRYFTFEDNNDILDFWENYAWSGASERLSQLLSLSDDKQTQVLDYILQQFYGDTPYLDTEINDFIWLDDTLINMMYEEDDTDMYDEEDEDYADLQVKTFPLNVNYEDYDSFEDFVNTQTSKYPGLKIEVDVPEEQSETGYPQVIFSGDFNTVLNFLWYSYTGHEDNEPIDIQSGDYQDFMYYMGLEDE